MNARASRLEWFTFERTSTALLFLALGFGACFSPAQNDTWWQLRTGQEIWNTGLIDLHDRFSHTADGAYWPNHEWLSQVLSYGVYRVGGLRLLTALAVILIVGAWWLVWRLTPGKSSRAVVLCALALVPSTMGWALRPQVLTLFLMAAAAVLIVRRRYLLLPPLFLLWANFHGGVTLGLALLPAGIIAAAVEERTLPLRLMAVSGVCILATALTPLGVSLWTEVPATLARTRPYGIMEWRPPQLTEPIFAPFWLLAGALVVLSLTEKPWRSTGPSGATIWAALALLPLAIASGRNVPPFVLMAVPAVASLWESRWPAGQRASMRIEHPALNAGLVIGLGLLGVVTVTRAWASEIPRLGWHPLPKEAIAALASCPDRLYNRYDEGGYLIWFVPGRKVFLDSRQDPYPSALVHEQIRVETSGDYTALFDRYAIGCAFVAADSPIAARLTANGWEGTYKGSGWLVAIHN